MNDKNRKFDLSEPVSRERMDSLSEIQNPNLEKALRAVKENFDDYPQKMSLDMFVGFLIAEGEICSEIIFNLKIFSNRYSKFIEFYATSSENSVVRDAARKYLRENNIRRITKKIGSNLGQIVENFDKPNPLIKYQPRRTIYSVATDTINEKSASDNFSAATKILKKLRK